MAEEILINITPREVRIAILENSVLQEVHIERGLHHGLVGNIYKGRINRLLPGIQAAFVDIGLERSAFLHVTDVQGYEERVNAAATSAEIDVRDMLKPSQDLLVQIYKDPLGSKGARLTTQFTIPSRYLVFTPGNPHISVSQKITDEAERARLMAMITPDPEGGYIFRTAAEGITQADVDADKVFLQALWAEVLLKNRHAKPGDVVYEEIPIVFRVLRDLVGFKIEKIRVDHPPTAKEMRDFAARYVPALVDRIEDYSAELPLFDLYSVEDALQKALYRKVYLKSGGHLIFDQTEAMTTIDVNTGSYLGAGNLEKTIFKTNQEAVDVIARQLRLRNLGGIIIIDFIDMMDDLHKEHILQTLSAALAKDSARIQISELSSLGLVQLTRKRARESLEHILCVPCPLCHKRGSIKSLETVSYEIFREIKRSAQLFGWPGFLVIAAEKVVNCLMDEQSTLLADLEHQLGKRIKLRVELLFTQEQYNILPLSEME